MRIGIRSTTLLQGNGGVDATHSSLISSPTSRMWPSSFRCDGFTRCDVTGRLADRNGCRTGTSVLEEGHQIDDLVPSERIEQADRHD